jgi:hypothetical protein
MEDRKEIQITEATKGVMVYAKSGKPTTYGDWLLLIDYVKYHPAPICDLVIYTHFSLCVMGGYPCESFIHDERWGYVSAMGFTFYEVTEEEKNKIKAIFKENGYKFVKGVNKLFKR